MLSQIFIKQKSKWNKKSFQMMTVFGKINFNLNDEGLSWLGRTSVAITFLDEYSQLVQSPYNNEYNYFSENQESFWKHVFTCTKTQI